MKVLRVFAFPSSMARREAGTACNFSNSLNLLDSLEGKIDELELLQTFLIPSRESYLNRCHLHS